MKPEIYFGSVMHARLRPHRNAFRYRVFFMRLPLLRLDRIRNPLFSVNRWNLFSFHYSDHGARDGSPPELWIRRLLEGEGVQCADGEVVLQTFPRVLGYVFNPVSFWLCHDREGGLRAIVCQVSNTFGEHHNYLLARPDGAVIRSEDVLESRKVFHVSPFCEVSGKYAFRFQSGVSTCNVNIDYDDPEGRLLLTAISGRASEFTIGALLRAFFLYPWMTLGVMARIHWQALKLWIGGVPYVPKPLPPQQETTR
ncbi:MAG TPA: DUF1365 domain-containing protein [Burkholderiales bacterium]|jgi:DUF1365 family protein|nr:DUF1365 domain-containing protein [Burkholderiales bacterium]